MDTMRRQADGLLDVVRVLLLLQGSILLATTLEALFWSVAFAGPSGSSVLLSGVAAAALFIARARLRADRRGTRRLVYVVEGALLVTLALDAVLALLITAGAPPVVAIVTRLALPASVIALLRRSARVPDAPTTPAAVVVTEGAS